MTAEVFQWILIAALVIDTIFVRMRLSVLREDTTWVLDQLSAYEDEKEN